MNRTGCKVVLFCIVFILFFSDICLATNLEVKTDNTDLKKLLKDVVCVTVSDKAKIVLNSKRENGVFYVSDNKGVLSAASSLQEALNDYLKKRGVCVIHDIEIEGAERISKDAILFRISSSKGDIVSRSKIKKDIENIYSMGYFETCDASYVDGKLVYKVKEYPIVISIDFNGNKEIKDKDLSDTIGIKRFDVLNMKMVKTAVDRIKRLYKEKGYYNVEVSSSEKKIKGGERLTFNIKENERLFVKKVMFDGNRHISSRRLRKIMKIKNRWPLGLFSHEGSYTESDMDTDLLRIEQYYGDNGYLDAKVGSPEVVVKKRKGIYITIPIDEGPLYRIGKVSFDGDLIVSNKVLAERLGMSTGDVMSKSKLRIGIEKLRDIYMDRGYAYAKIVPLTKIHGTDVDLKIEIKKGKPVHIRNIIIKGNTKTRDKVIRRELAIQETDLFSSTAVKKSQDNLNRLGYFSKVDIEPVTRADGTMDLVINVEEKTTGSLSFGFAYSSVDKLMGTMQLSEINFKGLGYKTRLDMDIGGSKKSYDAEFQNPWLFDRPISFDIRLYSLERDLTYYRKSSRGGSITISYPLFEEFRHYISYAYEEVLKLEDIDPAYKYLLTKDEINGGVTSTLTNTIARDTTNDYYRPTRGSRLSISLNYAGLGGDYCYTRLTAMVAKFFPIYKDKVALMLKARWGTINGGRGKEIPVYDLFTLGGINTIRGFKYEEVGPRDDMGNVVGGRRMVVFNTEVTFPIANVPGLTGVLFFDAGNAYLKRIDLGTLKESYGGGFRWITPMGPLRIEYGKVINPKDYESSGRWEFTVGRFF